MDNDGLFSAIRARQRGLARNIGRPLEGRWRKRLEMADEERQRRDLLTEAATSQKPHRGCAGRGSVPVQPTLQLSMLIGSGPGPPDDALQEVTAAMARSLDMFVWIKACTTRDKEEMTYV